MTISPETKLAHYQLSRRRMLEALMVVPASAVVVAACGGSAASTSTAADVAQATAVPTTAPAATAVATAAPAATAAATAEATAAEVVASAVSWASGGTDLITVGYPDTSLFDTADACSLSLMEATTEGPCYFSSDTGEDISLGKTGLPMQLCLRLIDQGCLPLAGYTVEVWHCDTRGVYSGDTSASADADSFAGDFCTAGDAEAETSTYLRGQLTTDTDGRVNFMSVLPGWYAGRTIHIHFAITDPDGTTRLISQFCFTDELTEEICTSHDQYADRGVQDTPLEGGTDTVFPGDSYEDFLLTANKNADGSLLAFASVQIDPSAVAAAAGGGGGGGEGRGEPPSGERPEGPPPGE